jgi:hypothetical protein
MAMMGDFVLEIWYNPRELGGEGEEGNREKEGIPHDSRKRATPEEGVF